jgi:ferric-dicitrate binding protein FerR (iron transport regulator)
LDQHRHIATLFRKYLNNECTPEEAAALMAFIRSSKNRKLVQSLLDDHFRDGEDKSGMYRYQTDRIFQRLNLNENMEKVEAQSRSIQFTFLKIAAVVLLILASAWAVLVIKSPAKQELVATKPAEDVLPGGSKAVLVLSDGQQVKLDSLQSANPAGDESAVVKRSAAGHLVYFAADNSKLKGFNTVKTPRGGQYEVILPDGSKIWLNAASSITYPAAFNAGERRVVLTGEAYFEIASLWRNNKKVPFVVETGKQKIEVLGTRFNVNAYDDEAGIKTTLIEGKVKVTTENETIILKPNHEFNLGLEGISTKKVDVEPVIDWKNGDFLFADEDLESVMRKVARWYNVELIYDSEIPEERLSGQISRSRNLSEVLRMLELSGDTKFRIEDGAVHIFRPQK